MAPKPEHTLPSEKSQGEFQALLKEKLLMAIRLTMVTILEEELEAYLQAEPYQRICTRQDQRNGYYRRDLGTSLGTVAALPVPRARGGFQTKLFKRYKVSRKSVPTFVGTLFEFWGVCFIIHLYPPQFEPQNSISPTRSFSTGLRTSVVLHASAPDRAVKHRPE